MCITLKDTFNGKYFLKGDCLVDKAALTKHSLRQFSDSTSFTYMLEAGNGAKIRSVWFVAVFSPTY